jgi:hypothetical protein
VATVLLGYAVVAPGAPPVHGGPARATGWVLTRTAPGPAVLRGTFTGNAGSAEATAVLFALSGHGRDRKLDGAFTTARIDWGADAWPRVYGDVQPDCPASCGLPAASPAGFGFSSNRWPMDATVYIALWDVVDVSIAVSTPGWRVRRWQPSMRAVPSDRAGETGLRATHTTAGTFRLAEAQGGRHGSLGWGHVPCDNYGEGRATLTGGTRRWSLDCDGGLGAMSTTLRPTRWRLAGDVTGVGRVVNVLVVVDFPAG